LTIAKGVKFFNKTRVVFPTLPQHWSHTILAKFKKIVYYYKNQSMCTLWSIYRICNLWTILLTCTYPSCFIDHVFIVNWENSSQPFDMTRNIVVNGQQLVLRPHANTLNISYNLVRVNIIFACDRKKIVKREIGRHFL